jgi:hypothetical protein
MRDRIYRAEMGMPPMPDEGAPGPLTRRQRMDKMVIGSPKDLRPGDRRMLNPVLEPVDGEEIGMEERKSKVYKKKMASGGYTTAADGCCKKGKTRGKMV